MSNNGQRLSRLLQPIGSFRFLQRLRGCHYVYIERNRNIPHRKKSSPILNDSGSNTNIISKRYVDPVSFSLILPQRKIILVQLVSFRTDIGIKLCSIAINYFTTFKYKVIS